MPINRNGRFERKTQGLRGWFSALAARGVSRTNSGSHPQSTRRRIAGVLFNLVECTDVPGSVPRGNRDDAYAVLFAIALLLGEPASWAADTQNGRAAFENLCANCHTTVSAQNSFGPSLAGLIERRSGTLLGYRYSQAMRNADITWNASSLDEFLQSSTSRVPGTSMDVSISDASVRADLVEYLLMLGTSTPSAPPKIGAASTLDSGPTSEDLRKAATDRESWLYASKDFSGKRYVESTQITVANAGEIRAKCIYRASTATSATQSNLTVYKGIIYFTVDELTVAIDAVTCRQRWVHHWHLGQGVLSKTNRGVALKEGRLVRGTADGYLIALSMKDGTPLWSRKIADPTSGQYLSMPPMIFEDKVIYGPAGADWGAKNWIGAFSLLNGDPLWRFNLIPDANEPGADSWTNSSARDHGGGSVWSPLSLDADEGVLYVPVGNPSPDFFGAVRPGSNLYTNSVVALDVRTGKLLWFHQFDSADVQDRDLSQVSPLFTAVVKGVRRNLIAISGKDGLLRVLDRRTHEQLYEIPITNRKGWNSTPTPEGAHSCPGLLGGMEWNGPAYDVVSSTLYISSVDWCGTFFKATQPPEFTTHAHYYGGAVTPDPRARARGWIEAIDASTGRARWTKQWPTPLVSGIVVTAGGVLFTGDLDNNFLAIDASTGNTLYSFNTGGTLGGGVVSYEVGDKQFVAAISGTVSAFFGGEGPAAVLVFGLP